MRKVLATGVKGSSAIIGNADFSKLNWEKSDLIEKNRCHFWIKSIKNVLHQQRILKHLEKVISLLPSVMTVHSTNIRVNGENIAKPSTIMQMCES